MAGSSDSKGGLFKGAASLAGVLAMIVAVLVVVLMNGVTLLTALVQAEYGQLCTSSSSPTSWVAAARAIAQDDSHGYSQPKRFGDPDFDCASLVWYSLKQAGFDVGAAPFWTGTEQGVLEKAGFERLPFSRDSLQVGDILWNPGHTEIYAGDNKVISADHDENHKIQGLIPGDQKGDEIAEHPLYERFQEVWRVKPGTLQAVSGSTTLQASAGSSSSVSAAVSGSTAGGLDGVVGLDEAGVEAWFGGAQGPDNKCAAYAYGQCTWYACIRGSKLGWKGIGSHWGNGQDWARSAAAAGYRTTMDAPVPGALMSIPAGLLKSNVVYGHVLVVESVDTVKGTITTSEKGAGYRVYSRTLPIRNGATYILPNDQITGAGSGDGSSLAMCAAGASSGSVSSAGLSSGDPKAIAKSKMGAYGWDDSQYQCLVTLWEHESGWNPSAENPSSGAYGIPQSLPGSKMASAGADWRTNPATQIDWGLNYIHGRYGSPCSAWAFWQSKSPHWY